jgi:4-hydroxythreonine-4-phosphate dehydrogenase
MIYVSSGHERGVGLEIFFKSYLLLSKDFQKEFCLAIDQTTYLNSLNDLKLNPANFKNLNLHFTNDLNTPQSTSSLLWCLNKIQSNDILITLPTSKDQLIFESQNKAGYTEFFRSYYQSQNISMIFKSFTENVLLISDHIPLKDVSAYITQNKIFEKVKVTVDGFNKYFSPIDEIVLAGINPHAGENGILGPEEVALKNVPLEIFSKLGIKCSHFLSGDTLHFYKNESISQLFIYMYHDQALSKFKAQNGLVGLNVTFGLPFLRLSVDHGTAFELYGKNKANLSGMIYLLSTALEVNKNVNK